jgi:hypothetical protein
MNLAFGPNNHKTQVFDASRHVNEEMKEARKHVICHLIAWVELSPLQVGDEPFFKRLP